MKLVRYFEGEKKSELSLLNIKQKLLENVYGIMTIKADSKSTTSYFFGPTFLGPIK